jgi:nucleotide-binding universal stress UspA family protein
MWTGTFPLLLATDGSDLACAAARVADAIARQRGAVPRVLHVLEPPSSAVPPEALAYTIGVTDLLYSEEYQREQRERIRETIHRVLTATPGWPIDIAVGDPASCITRTAQAMQAGLIVMGLRHHGIVDRMVNAETTRQVMRHGGVPVLGVRPALTGLPRRVIAAIDFSPASLRAVASVLRFMDEDGLLLLTYVHPPADYRSTEAAAGEGGIHTYGVEAAFRQLQQELEVPPGTRVESVILSGNPGDRLEKLARTFHPDVLTIGSQRLSFLNRVILGSVTTALVRRTTCSVLVTPPASYSASNPSRSAN